MTIELRGIVEDRSAKSVSNDDFFPDFFSPRDAQLHDVYTFTVYYTAVQRVPLHCTRRGWTLCINGQCFRGTVLWPMEVASPRLPLARLLVQSLPRHHPPWAWRAHPEPARCTQMARNPSPYRPRPVGAVSISGRSVGRASPLTRSGCCRVGSRSLVPGGRQRPPCRRPS